MKEGQAETTLPPYDRATAERALRRLFLMLFLRGRSARGLQRSTVPSSIVGRLWGTLVLYAFVGLVALVWRAHSVFALSIYLHTMTFVFVGTFVAASAGEVLFNKDESDMLLHRPVTARALLWCKITVLLRVSLWLAGAFNLVGLFAGLSAPDAQPWFPLVHLVSTTLVAVVCVATVVLVYELCLRWFGRERLDGLITLAQVIVAISAVLVGQVPRLVMPHVQGFGAGLDSTWALLLPPAWFAGFDAALAGSGATSAWICGGIGVTVSLGLLRLALGRLALDYEQGLRVLGESGPAPRGTRARRRFIHALAQRWPFSWWLGDPVSRASCLLCLAYLARNRETKLRVYPSAVPLLVMPLLLFAPSAHFGPPGLFIAFGGACFGIITMSVHELLQYSDHPGATDVFQLAPLPGPQKLLAGARRAVLAFLALPLLLMLAPYAWMSADDPWQLLLLIPGLMLVPVYSLWACVNGKGLPLSRSADPARAGRRGLIALFSVAFALTIAGLATWAWADGWFVPFISVEGLLAVSSYVTLRRSVARTAWASIE